MERYEIIKDIGSGNFGVAKLVKEKWTGQLYAVKFIERGFKVHLLFCCHLLFSCTLDFGSLMGFYWVLQIDEHVQREIINHRSLKHPNIIRFKEVQSSRLFLSMNMHPVLYEYAPKFSFVPEWNKYSDFA